MAHQQYTIWDYLSTMELTKKLKDVELRNLEEVRERQHIIDETENLNKKKNKHINIPNATIKYFHYRPFQDPQQFQRTTTSESIRKQQNSKPQHKRHIESNREQIQENIEQEG
jgi:hypothetical protein